MDTMRTQSQNPLEVVPFLDLTAQQTEVADEVLPRWAELFRSAAFIGGPDIDAFENEYAAYVGVNYCIGVANGTDAIELALRGVGVEAGDEVILPANTFIATAEAVSRVGAHPVLVDVDEDYLLMDPQLVEAAITQRTRAVIPVHLFGQTAPMDDLVPIAEHHGLPIIEDCAQSQGATSSYGRAGALGVVAATSFYPGKNLGAAGDAGGVLTDDDAIALRVREIANHGSLVKYVHTTVGVNSRLDAIQAVLLRAKLRRLETWNEARREAADRYEQLLADASRLRTPKSRPGNVDAWHLYVVRVPNRDTVLARLIDEGIGASVHYPTPLHLTDAYRHLGYRLGQFPVAEAAAGQILSLPLYPHISPEEQQRVSTVLKRVLSRAD